MSVGTQNPRIGFYSNYSTGADGWTNEYNANADLADTLIQCSVISRILTSPPGTPANGDCYIPAVGSTDEWVGLDKTIVIYRAGIAAWESYQPKDGWQAVIISEGTWGTLSTYIGGSWSPGLTLT